MVGILRPSNDSCDAHHQYTRYCYSRPGAFHELQFSMVPDHSVQSKFHDHLYLHVTAINVRQMSDDNDSQFQEQIKS